MMKRKTDIIFVLLLLAVSFFYDYPAILFSRPSYHHIWRQTDCLSITMNYYRDNRNFFEPAILYDGGCGGKTASEFPVIYYTVAQLWKIFGYHEFIFRLVNILIVFTGLYCLFRLAREFLEDDFWAIMVPIYLFSSPILVFYTNNFLADAPAFGFALIACYFYWKGISRERKKWFWLAFLFFALAGVLKISSLLIFIALLIIHIYILLFKRKQKGWLNQGSLLIPYFLVFVVIALWYGYVHYYNKHNMSGIFLQGILPIWEIDKNTINQVYKSLYDLILPSYFTMPALWAEGVLLLLLFVFFKRVNKYFLFLSWIVFIGCIGFVLLFYQVFTIHDYYMTNLLIFIPLPLLAALDLSRRRFPLVFKHYIPKIIFAGSTLILLYVGAVDIRMKYNAQQPFVQKNLVIKKEKIVPWVLYENYSSKYLKALETITPYLRQIGIKRDDLVLSIPDWGINITLYLMDQKGYTDFISYSLPEDRKIAKAIEYGVRYLVVNDTAVYSKPNMAQYLQHRIGKYRNVEIFDLKTGESR